MRAILTYHSIDETGSVISIAPDVFAEHMRWFATHGVRVVSLDDLVDSRALDDEDRISLTFDDGFANFTDAASVLEQYGFPATVFVVSAHVGGTNAWGGRSTAGIPTLPLLGWADLERLASADVTVGAHTRTHAKLTGLSRDAIAEEMDGCATEIRERLGTPSRHFAYPYGDINHSVETLAASRFAVSVTTRFSPLANDDARMRLPRLDMYYFRRPGAIRSWGTWRFAPMVWSVRTRRRLRESFT